MEAWGIHHHPNVPGSQVIILVADYADVLIAVPNIAVWNRRHHNRCRR
jgi:hypothetical protein